MEKTYGRRGVSAIDPMFFIPDGVDELDYDAEGFYDEDELLDTSVEDPEGADEEEMPVPTIIGITQTLRENKAGTDVVDIIVEVEDIEGIKEFDIRVAKR